MVWSNAKIAPTSGPRKTAAGCAEISVSGHGPLCPDMSTAAIKPAQLALLLSTERVASAVESRSCDALALSDSLAPRKQGEG